MNGPWRCANKRKRPAPREMQPHLGDVPDMGPSPMTLYRPVKIRAWPGVVIVCVVVLVMFFIALAAASK